MPGAEDVTLETWILKSGFRFQGFGVLEFRALGL